MDKNKKIFLGLGISILVIGLFIATMFIGADESGTSSTLNQDDPNVIVANAERQSKAIVEDQMKELEKINLKTYLDYYNGSEIRIVFVARPTCPYCEIAEPLIRKIAKDHDLTISYLNTDEFTDDDQANFVKHNEAFSEGFGTPMLLVVANGEIVTAMDGLTDSEHYLEFLKSNNLI